MNWRQLTILNPDHLFDQARRLIRPPSAGAPRQVDLRRAISNAYYGVFHFVLTAAADEFAGVTQRASAQYALVYRHIDHRRFRELCNEIRKPSLPGKYVALAPEAGFSQAMKGFAAVAVDLQLKRHLADYDPQSSYSPSDAAFAIDSAVTAIQSFKSAVREERKMFLTLLVFPPR
jgi:hypothetical protein